MTLIRREGQPPSGVLSIYPSAVTPGSCFLLSPPHCAFGSGGSPCPHCALWSCVLTSSGPQSEDRLAGAPEGGERLDKGRSSTPAPCSHGTEVPRVTKGFMRCLILGFQQSPLLRNRHTFHP